MNIVIQCAASKSSDAGFLLDSQNRRVMFVADPGLAPHADNIRYAKPDDNAGAKSWRELLVSYNENPQQNQLGLLPAYRLYRNEAYSSLVEHFGLAKVFILSAGWGLINANFLTPYYDITFSASAEKFKRRRKNDRYNDFSQLPISSTEELIFFGGKDYIPLFHTLSQEYRGTRYIPYSSKAPPQVPNCQLVKYETKTRTNWHYECVRAYLEGRFAIY
ncbi:MAG: hypothetical protein ABGY96_02995 [bacterium]|nr:hypothetical protein [Pseudomonadales bacterium]